MERRLTHAPSSTSEEVQVVRQRVAASVSAPSSALGVTNAVRRMRRVRHHSQGSPALLRESNAEPVAILFGGSHASLYISEAAERRPTIGRRPARSFLEPRFSHLVSPFHRSDTAQVIMSQVQTRESIHFD